MDTSQYTPFFCEENIWKVTNSINCNNLDKFNVLFLTNPKRKIALFNQKIVPLGEITLWDYHVILHDTVENIIYDFDTRLKFNSNFSDYFLNTFPEQKQLPEEFRTFIRIIPAAQYKEHLHSDRSHMIKNGVQLADFPKWPAILNTPSLTFTELLELSESIYIKETLSINKYLQRFI